MRRYAWLAVVAVLAALAALFLTLTQARPTYDGMGFLVWGQQALHLNFNLNGAPSWKPLPFLATLPYALAGRPGQEWLWTFTSDFAAGAAVVLAARLAYRLSPEVHGRRWARVAGALVAAYGVATLVGLLEFALIANSDQLVVALLLAAIDVHVSRRPRAAFALLWLAALGRPEVWPFLVLYGAYTWRQGALPAWLTVTAVLAAPAVWFVVPGLTSKSWLQASNLALGQKTAIHGNKLIGVFERLRTLTVLPMQVATLVAIVIGLRGRDRRVLWLTAAALLWFCVEVAFALHGFSAVARYLIEPGAVLMVVAGIGVATLLSRPSGPARWLGPLAVAALVVSLFPYTHRTLVTDHALISQAHTDARVLGELEAVIRADGGPRRLLACGRPFAPLGYQSTVAWDLGLNVGTVFFGVGAGFYGHTPAVLVVPRRRGPVIYGWHVLAVHEPPARAAACRGLDRSVAV